MSTDDKAAAIKRVNIEIGAVARERLKAWCLQQDYTMRDVVIDAVSHAVLFGEKPRKLPSAAEQEAVGIRQVRLNAELPVRLKRQILEARIEHDCTQREFVIGALEAKTGLRLVDE